MAYTINDILKEAVERKASDIHLRVGKPVIFRINGELVRWENFPKLLENDIKRFFDVLTTREQKVAFSKNRVLDFAVSLGELARFRINAFYQRGTMAMAIRVIPKIIKTIRELNLPAVIEKLALSERGLILVTGVAGVGKSTTLAAMLSHISKNRALNIITIEDPIEYLIPEEKSIIAQKEVGIDVPSFYAGLRDALRQDPNVIMVGEMRDLETIETALIATETGHLVLSTLHTMDAKETINRIVSIFPPNQQSQIRVQLASVLRAVISQRLVPMANGKGRVPAVEILVNNARIRDIIIDPKRLEEIPQAIAEGHVPYGMQTFDQSLYKLWKKGLIDEETAMEFATSPEKLAMKMRGITRGVGDTWKSLEREEI